MSPTSPSFGRHVMQLGKLSPVSVGLGSGLIARHLVVAIATLAAVSSSGRCDDAVVLSDGRRVSGSIVSLGPDAIELETRSGVAKYGIGDIREVAFDGEPETLAIVRGLLRRRDGRRAKAELEKISDAIEATDSRIRDEYAFLKAAAAAQAATTTEGAATAQALSTFLTRNARSHHFFEGQEILGDLYARLGKFAEAAAAYGELNRGPAPMRVRSAANKAQLLLQQGKPGDAIREFEAATKIPTEPGDAASASQKGEAQLGIARCLAKTGKASDGVQAARAAIRAADPDDGDLLAAAFVALGECQRAVGGKEEDALISFLTVDLVYNKVPDRHAEALYNLVELWDARKQPERAREARKALTSTYPDSPWSKKLGAAAKAS
jgi:tetratricopeptide (TPR) repeat protein